MTTTTTPTVIRLTTPILDNLMQIADQWDGERTVLDTDRVMLAAKLLNEREREPGFDWADQPQDWETACHTIARRLQGGHSVAAAVGAALAPLERGFTVYGYVDEYHPAEAGHRAEHHLPEIITLPTEAEAQAWADGYLFAQVGNWDFAHCEVRPVDTVPPTFAGCEGAEWNSNSHRDSWGDYCEECDTFMQDGDEHDPECGKAED